MSKLLILDQVGEPYRRCNRAAAMRMVALGQAEYTPTGHSVRLIGPTEAMEHPCRTRTARHDPLLSACGRSQEYTTRDQQNRVDGFKQIYPEDRGAFIAAVLDNMAVVRNRGPVVLDGQHRILSISPAHFAAVGIGVG